MSDNLHVEAISKRYGSHEVLRDVSLTLKRGQALSLVGRNGAGKSTLLRCIAGQVFPDSGAIWISGYGLYDQPEAARSCFRYLPQEVPMPDRISAFELVEFYAGVYGEPLACARLLELAGLSSVANQAVRNLSVGMQRRLAFASLFAGQAKLFVLDEPFAGLDRDSRARFTRVLKHRLHDGASLLIATHEQDHEEVTQLECARLELHA